MKLGIIGLPQTGKKTLFQLLTESLISESALESKKNITGVANIKDSRFDVLAKMYNPKKEAHARIDMVLLPKIESDTIKTGKIFQEIADMDALCHIVRAFNDDSVYHVQGSVDPKRDIEDINSELIMYDLIFIEKRLERLNKNRKKNDKDTDFEENLLLKFKTHLEADLHLRSMEISEEEAKLIKSYPFITMKRMLIVLNIDDDTIGNSKLIDELLEKYSDIDMDIMQASAKVEQEIASLEDIAEKIEFMEALGIKESALNKLSALGMKSLNLMSFFTVGEDEVRQWLTKKDSTAPVAAGAIHSDIERGFIRAEVMKYNELIDVGSEDALKKAGKFHVMGKDYVVEDGDIINFRFNV